MIRFVIRFRAATATLCMALACCLQSARSQDVEAPSFEAPSFEAPSFEDLAASVDVADADAVLRARRTLEEHDPQFWQHAHKKGSFRSALVHSLTPDDVRQQLDLASREYSTLSSVIRNLVSRRDLGSLLVEDDRVGPLLAQDISLLEKIADAELYEGRRGLALRLLSEPSHADAMTEHLIDWLTEVSSCRDVDEGIDRGAQERLLTWIETVAPRLDGGLVETVLEGLYDAIYTVELYAAADSDDIDDAPSLRRIRAAMQSVPAEGPRLRLLRVVRGGD